MLVLPPQSQWVSLKQDGGIHVYRAALAEGEVVIKAYQLNNWRRRWSFQAKCRRLRRFYRVGYEFVPQLFAAQLSECGQWGYLVYESVPGRDLRQLAADSFSEAELAGLAYTLGARLAQLHDGGWVHGDCKFGNWLYQPGVTPAQPQLALVDLEGVYRPGWRRDSACGRDVARLLLNSIEQDWPQGFAESVWRAYSGGLSAARLNARRHAVKRWFTQLAKRHQRAYGRQAPMALPFL